MTRHLVTGATGQDGRLLVDLLVAQGHDVVATALDGSTHPGEACWRRLDVTDESAVRRLVGEVRPDVVHHLAGRSSVAASWEDRGLNDRVNRRAALGMLDAAVDAGARFVFASSSEVFGPVAGGRADESTPLDPRSPYAEAKAAVHQAVQEVRRSGVAATNLVLFGHTSRLQTEGFVLPTLCRQAVDVAAGRQGAVILHDPAVRRDWGDAADVVRAFALAALGPSDDYVIATGQLHRLADVGLWALEAAGAPAPSPDLVRRAGTTRPADVDGVRGDARRAAEALGWLPGRPLREVIREIVGSLQQTLGGASPMPHPLAETKRSDPR